MTLSWAKMNILLAKGTLQRFSTVKLFIANMQLTKDETWTFVSYIHLKTICHFSPSLGCVVKSLPSERRADDCDSNFQLFTLITVINWPLLSQLVAGTSLEHRSRASNTRPCCPLHWLSYKTVDLKDTDNPMLQHETASSYKFSFNKTLASDRNKNNNNRERERL